MSTLPDLSSLLEQRTLLVDELIHTLSDYGQTRSAAARQRADSWINNGHLGTTDRREESHAAAARFSAEALSLESDIEALRARIGHIDTLLMYLPMLSPE